MVCYGEDVMTSFAELACDGGGQQLIQQQPHGLTASWPADQAERDLEIACRLGGVAVVVAYGRDDFPDVLACSHQPGSPETTCSRSTLRHGSVSICGLSRTGMARCGLA